MLAAKFCLDFAMSSLNLLLGLLLLANRLGGA
jgi:hypothetical protein